VRAPETISVPVVAAVCCCGILRLFGSQGQEESTTAIPTTLASTSMASQEQALNLTPWGNLTQGRIYNKA